MEKKYRKEHCFAVGAARNAREKYVRCGAGESLFTDIGSEKIIVDIRYSINELDVEISEMVDAQLMIPSYGVRSQKVGKRLILTNMDNPKMFFRCLILLYSEKVMSNISKLRRLSVERLYYIRNRNYFDTEKRSK